MVRIPEPITPMLRGLVLVACAWLMSSTAAMAAVATDPIAVPDGALAADVMHDGEARVEARLLIHPDDDPSGGPIRVGVLLDVAPEWHVYWRNPGETGLPTRVTFDIDRGRAGPLAWPTPDVFEEADGLFTTFGYAHRVLLVSRVELESEEGDGADRRIGAAVDLLGCRYECIPGEFALERSFQSRSGGDVERVRALFEEAASRVPVSPESVGARVEVRYDRAALAPEDPFHARLTVRSCETPAGADDSCPRLSAGEGWSFLPMDDRHALWPAAPGSGESESGEAGVVHLEIAGLGASDAADAAEAAEAHGRLRAVLRLRDAEGASRALRVDLPLPPSAAAASPEIAGWRDAEAWAVGGAIAAGPDDGAPSLWKALLLGLLGGLILNLMPCVLPVLAIKVVSVAEMARHERAEVLGHGAAYTAGVLFSMWALAAAVVVLRGAGSAVGWGFQFQEPLFVLAVCTVVVVFALNLFGVFEIGSPGGRLHDLGAEAVGWRRSFFEGLLAVVLATPCTAPFLGTAVGFAFASPGIVIFAIFTSVGAGLAAPFAVVSLVPGWGRFVPRAGAWMLTLRSGLGFALLGSAVWLLWIAGRSLGADGLALMLGFLVAVAFGVWTFGLLQRAHLVAWARSLAVGLLVFAVAGPLLVRLEPAASAAVPEPASDVAVYSPEAVQRELAAGRPVFVVFTADWCITCKVNEKGVIADEEIQSALRRWDVAVLRADWTRRDDAIRAELARFGRAGVPLYLVYSPGAEGDPEILPELLSVERLQTALKAAADAARGFAGR